MKKHSHLKITLSTLFVIVIVASLGIVYAIPPYPTTPATATVDGNPIEWDLI